MDDKRFPTRILHMAKSLQCAHCGADFEPSGSAAAGKKVKCPECKRSFVVEDEEELEQEDGDGEPAPKKKKKAA